MARSWSSGVTVWPGRDLRKALLVYTDTRGRAPRAAVASSRVSVAEALETLDMTHWALRDVSVALSPRITGTAAGDGDVFALGTGDLWVWSSPLLEFTYTERQCPGLVDLALFGYFAAKVRDGWPASRSLPFAN